MPQLPKLLIVDDDPSIALVVKAALRGAYRFETASNGVRGWEKIQSFKPDIVLSDYSMPGMNGEELCRKLKTDPTRNHLPFVMLTALADVDDIVRGLQAGADDYMCKPFSPEELRVRLQTQLRRRDHDLQADPLTHLPSGDLIRAELARRLEAGAPFAATYADLDHFKAFADHYGFLRASDVIRHTAGLLQQTALETVGRSAFVGHIAGDDFLLTCGIEEAEPLCRAIVGEFDAGIAAFYDPEDAQAGFILANSRDTGEKKRYPLLSLSLCVVRSDMGKLATPYDIAASALWLKERGKRQPGSVIVTNAVLAGDEPS